MYGWEPFPTIYFTHSHWLITLELLHPMTFGCQVSSSIKPLTSTNWMSFVMLAPYHPSYLPLIPMHVFPPMDPSYEHILLHMWICFNYSYYILLCPLPNPWTWISKRLSSSSKWCGHWMCMNIACLDESFTRLYNLSLRKIDFINKEIPSRLPKWMTFISPYNTQLKSWHITLTLI